MRLFHPHETGGIILKSNLKEQVADLQKENQELTKRLTTLQDRIENYLVPRLAKMDKEIVSLWSLEERIKQLEKTINREIVVEPEADSK
jgi:hypothetical protein